MNPRKVVCFLAVLLLASVPLALAQGTYTQIDYPGANLTYAFGINTAGDIAGVYVDTDGSFHGFLLSGGIYTTIDYPGARDTYVYGLNDLGQVVGQTNIFPGVGFVYDVSTQAFTQISYPGGSST
ncbi:MAG: hypothetical protein ACRD72_26510, partial [Candidatus Angelobacter sp.]